MEAIKGQAKEKWGKLTDDDLDVIDGRRQQLVGRIQERYGIAKDVAEQQADEFVKALKAEDREEQKAQRAGHRNCNTAGRFRVKRLAMARRFAPSPQSEDKENHGSNGYIGEIRKCDISKRSDCDC